MIPTEKKTTKIVFSSPRKQIPSTTSRAYCNFHIKKVGCFLTCTTDSRHKIFLHYFTYFSILAESFWLVCWYFEHFLTDPSILGLKLLACQLLGGQKSTQTSIPLLTLIESPLWKTGTGNDRQLPLAPLLHP